MPKLFSKEKVDKIFLMYMQQDLSRSEIATQLNMDADNVDKYLRKALNDYSSPSLIYKMQKGHSSQMSFLPAEEDDRVIARREVLRRNNDTLDEAEGALNVKKKFVRPPAVYSNQRSGYLSNNFNTQTNR